MTHPSQSEPDLALLLTPDEVKAVIWAARHGARVLRSEGWENMKRNAAILDTVREKLES